MIVKVEEENYICDFKTIENSSYTLEVKKSKFIANSFKIENEDEAKTKIREVREKYRGAKHNVYAFSLLNGISRSSDDREPHGTGGIQVLNCINEAKITNVIIVVTRYFGGILLGTGRLARAYYSCASLLIKNTKISEHCIYTTVRIKCSYKEYDKIVKSNMFKILHTEFSNEVKIDFSVKSYQLDDFKKTVESILSREVSF